MTARSRRPVLAALAIVLLLARPALAERLCGWLINPTPGNWWLRDRTAEWVLAEQGRFQAENLDAMPDMSRHGWVETNGSYGHGCACLDVALTPGSRRIARLLAARPLPLKRCAADRSLPRP